MMRLSAPDWSCLKLICNGFRCKIWSLFRSVFVWVLIFQITFQLHFLLKGPVRELHKRNVSLLSEVAVIPLRLDISHVNLPALQLVRHHCEFFKRDVWVVASVNVVKRNLVLEIQTHALEQAFKFWFRYVLIVEVLFFLWICAVVRTSLIEGPVDHWVPVHDFGDVAEVLPSVFNLRNAQVAVSVVVHFAEKIFTQLRTFLWLVQREVHHNFVKFFLQFFWITGKFLLSWRIIKRKRFVPFWNVEFIWRFVTTLSICWGTAWLCSILDLSQSRLHWGRRATSFQLLLFGALAAGLERIFNFDRHFAWLRLFQRIVIITRISCISCIGVAIWINIFIWFQAHWQSLVRDWFFLVFGARVQHLLLRINNIAKV